MPKWLLIFSLLFGKQLFSILCILWCYLSVFLFCLKPLLRNSWTTDRSTGTIQKSRILLWWALHKYCFVLFCFNIHGRHLELWPGVKLLYYNRPLNLTETCFIFLCCWDSEWLGSWGTWAFSSIPVGGGPSSKSLVQNGLSCPQHGPVIVKGEAAGSVSPPEPTRGPGTWKGSEVQTRPMSWTNEG